MTDCPSKAWDRHLAAEEAAHTPSDEDMLAKLDAYGHLNWAVGYDNDQGDWLACFDFEVFDHPERGKLVAYHVVVNSDSGGIIETAETAIVPAAKAPFNLPDRWVDIAADLTLWTEEDLTEAARCNERWNEELKVALAETVESQNE